MADSPYVFEVTTDNFQQVILQGSLSHPVLVDFWADWCAPCKALMPVLAKLVDEYQGKFILAKINTEEQRELAAQYGIRSLPTVKLFRDGQPVDEFMGALPEAEIRNFLDKNIPRESDLLLRQADTLLSQGDAEKAGLLLDQAQQMDPENPRVKLSVARYKATLGEFAEAEHLLQELPMEEQDKPEVASLMNRIHFDRHASEAPPAEQLEKTLQQDPSNPEALYQLASHKIMQSDYAGALELLFKLMQQDREYGDDAGRKRMLQVFDMLGGEGDLVKRYRNLMFNLMH